MLYAGREVRIEKNRARGLTYGLGIVGTCKVVFKSFFFF